jgi:putative PIN family toxin of toxin-antitoxin system
MRWVLDTDVVVAAMRSPTGASAGILQAALKQRVTMLANVALVLEYEMVCTREEHVAASGMDRNDVQIFIDGVVALVEPVPTFYFWRPQLRDAADEMVLEAAVNGQADAIVTFNRRDFGDAPQSFGVRVLLPRDAYRSLPP